MKKWTPFELHQTYMRGWSAGASVRALDPLFTRHDDTRIREQYEKGYEEGYAARFEASRVMCEITGYVPNILRILRAQGT